MLPRIEPTATVPSKVRTYLNKLKSSEYSGEICDDYASRLVVATDNSIYQVIPAAVLFPKTVADIECIFKNATKDISFAPRGGGTATNGQSLTAGIVIDCSKYMRQIIEVNLQEQWVLVQPGVILDQLNDYLQPFGFYFAPQVSTSSRATIGGMINTDACGNGSKLLGRTSDHILELNCVLSSGEILNSNNIPEPLADKLLSLLTNNAPEIDKRFINAPRTLCGYNLKKTYDPKLNLNYLIAGSEGTLAVVSEAKLKITPISKHKQLILLKYATFDEALRAPELANLKPLVIETIDEKLLTLARADKIYFKLKPLLDTGYVPGAINLIEFVAENAEALQKQINELMDLCDPNKIYIAKNAEEIKLLWDLRKKSVGLISKAQQGTRKPIPFIEDTAVPPEQLADFIAEFKQLLDKHNLSYGMYGHVDAGCVHIRPALDMKLEYDEKLMLELSENVVTLLEKYNGVMWGEHGKGYRSELGPRFFGEQLSFVLRQIKTLFDPHNQLNPGKIAVPLDVSDALVKLAGPFRGHFDKQIPEGWQQDYALALHCNGNGACFNDALAEPMCPSYKATKNRIHSPKGRAVLVREWLRQLALLNFQLVDNIKRSCFLKRLTRTVFSRKDFSHQVYDAMSGCLSCKACAGQCPLQVDVPDFKARFLMHYYQRYLHPLRDYFIAKIESFSLWQNRFPYFSRLVFHNPLSQLFSKWFLKMVDAPLPSTVAVRDKLSKHFFNADSRINDKTVVLIQDAFTSFYEAELVIAVFDFLTALGFNVLVLPFFENGKPKHVKGFVANFRKVVQRNAQGLQKLAEKNIPLMGIDPSMTLTYRDEYKKIVPNMPEVLLPQEWLLSALDKIPKIQFKTQQAFFLLSHCTEKTMCIEAETQWQMVFKKFGVELTILPAGCCGMAGTYGHEAEHVHNSKVLFDASWQPHFENNNNTILATGFSCRCQVKRFTQRTIQHPLAALSILNQQRS